jgi:hypothetical protein
LLLLFILAPRRHLLLGVFRFGGTLLVVEV